MWCMRMHRGRPSRYSGKIGTTLGRYVLPTVQPGMTPGRYVLSTFQRAHMCSRADTCARAASVQRVDSLEIFHFF